ncbi:MAG: helix-turn-helix domain-containing protein [Azospirillum sp.]|nr:helix-turn-helix domain-containing protein [Azospirillum sp.]MCA3268474.1 helix-turn-helix domain-containing protein [Azospirillum sp.]
MDRAISAIGGVVKTAALCGVSPQAVSQWTRVPPAHVARVAAESGIPAHELRPDVFPAPLGARDPVITSARE